MILVYMGVGPNYQSNNPIPRFESTQTTSIFLLKKLMWFSL